MSFEDEKRSISIEDMPNEDLVLVAKSCGIEVAAILLQKLPGLTINIPKTGMRKIANRYICDNYDGSNTKDLALECGVSIRHIYSVVGKSKKHSISKKLK